MSFARSLTLAAACAATLLLAACGDDEPPIVTRACTSGAGAGSNGLQLFGTASYRNLSAAADQTGNFQLDPGEISFNNPNLSPSSRTGTLRVTMWAVPGDYRGGALSGYVVTRYPINFTDGTSWLVNGESSNLIEKTLSGTTPPRGSYCVALTLEEFSTNCTTSDGFCIADWMQFASANNFE